MEESRKEFADRMLEKELSSVPEGDHPNPDVRVWQKAAAQATARGERLGRMPPPDLSDAHMVGDKDQDRNDLSNFEDVARLMDTYQINLMIFSKIFQRRFHIVFKIVSSQTINE